MPLSTANDAPSDWLGLGYTATAGSTNNIGFTIGPSGLVNELTAAEANPNTGDVRKVVWSLLDALYRKWDAKVASLPTADRPARISFNRNISFSSTGMTHTYTFTAQVVGTNIDVANE
jgi:hypothetical protein